MIKISIIIPVFNAEKYLERCVESILASLGKINGEILLVNNNSTDHSQDIIDDLKKRYKSKIKSLHCDTPNASAPRNYGVTRARGEYIWFIDADDAISKDAISKLINEADKTKADLVMMGAERIYEKDNKNYLAAVPAGDKSRFVRYGIGPWQVLIRRKWWLKNNFKFNEKIIHEDMELMSSLILFTDNFSSVNRPLYYYYQNPGSLLHKTEFSPRIFDIFPALEGLYAKFVDQKAEQKYHAELEWFFIWNLLIDSAKDFAKFPEGKPGFKHSREMLKKYFPNWRKNKFLRQKPLKLQIRVRLNYHK